MKTKIGLLLIAFTILFAFKSSQLGDGPNIKKGMIKVAIFYPNEEGKTFDMDYYANKHMPMAARLFGDSLKAMTIDKGLANGAPDTPVQYVAIGHFYFDTMSSFQNSMGPNQEKLRADVPNYTNIKPVIQISEVQTVK